MAKTPQPSRAAQTRQPATPSVDAALRDIVAGYKRRVAGAYRPVTIDDVGSIPPGALLVSRKLDGELWCLFAGPAGPQLINPRGRAVVEGSPILAAAAACLPAGVVLAGELHGPFEGRRERVGDVATALASGDPALCFTAFDVVQDADGAEPADGYEARLAQLDRWLGTATGTLRRVSTERLPDVTALRAHYQTIVVDGGAEGLVVRASNGLIYKLKPVIDLDAVVVGFTEKAAEPGHVRSLLLGLRHEDGRVHVLGGCGTLEIGRAHV